MWRRLIAAAMMTVALERARIAGADDRYNEGVTAMAEEMIRRTRG
jgi:hypothetical protein